MTTNGLGSFRYAFNGAMTQLRQFKNSEQNNPVVATDSVQADVPSSATYDEQPQDDTPQTHSQIIPGDQRGGEANGRNQVFLNNPTYNGQQYGEARSTRQSGNRSTDQNISQEIESIQENLGQFDGSEGVDVSYNYQSGDTLTDLAQGILRANTDNLDGAESELDGSQVGKIREQIMAQNNITDARDLRVRQELDLTGIVSRLPAEETAEETPANSNSEQDPSQDPQQEQQADPAQFQTQIDGANQEALSALDNTSGPLTPDERRYIEGELGKGVTVDQLVASGQLLDSSTVAPQSGGELSNAVIERLGTSGTMIREASEDPTFTQDLAQRDPELLQIVQDYFQNTNAESINKQDLQAIEYARNLGFEPDHIVNLLAERH